MLSLKRLAFIANTNNTFFINLWDLDFLFRFKRWSRERHPHDTLVGWLFHFFIEIDWFNEGSCFWFETFWHTNRVDMCLLYCLFFASVFGWRFSDFTILRNFTIELRFHMNVKCYKIILVYHDFGRKYDFFD